MTNKWFIIQAVFWFSLNVIVLYIILSAVFLGFKEEQVEIVGSDSYVIAKCADSAYSIPIFAGMKQPFDVTEFEKCLKENDYIIRKR